MGDFFLKSVRWTPSDYRDVITNYIIEECGDDRQGLILFSQFVVSYVSQFEDFCQRGITVMWLQSWSMWRWQKSKVNVTCPENRSVGRRTARTTTGWSNDNKLRPAFTTQPQFLKRQRQRQWQRQRHRQRQWQRQTHLESTFKERSQKLVTFDQSDEETWIVSCLPTYLLPMYVHPKRAIIWTCDIWDTDYNTDNWDPESMTIFVAWQLRVTLDSIRNSCDVSMTSLQ